MDALGARPHHAPVRVLPHIKRLDDGFGDFLVRVVCECGASREDSAAGTRPPGRLANDPQGARATNAMLEVWP